jgi:hypothetical protein
MAFVHGKSASLLIATKDVSPFVKTSTEEMSSDFHDVTGYGKSAHVKFGGLLDGKWTCSGTYDNTVSVGPRNAIKPLLGTTVAVVWKPEGTGTTKPQDAFSGVITKYVETTPVDDMITWSCEIEISDVITTTAQP